MRFDIRPSAADAARAVARLIAESIRTNPAVVLALPTGRTTLALYRALVDLCRTDRIDFRAVRTFNLDEFAGLPPIHPGSYRAFMARHLFRHVNLAPEHVHLPRGDAPDLGVEAARYEAAIAAAGGIELAVVGLGANGHIGFNEPAAALVADTHVARLTLGSRRANAWMFGGRTRNVPTHALSMGAATILRARRVVLLATGTSKASIVARACQGPVTTRVPASLLQTHPSAVVVLDRAAASRLTVA
jgi:glucosamine-6-phosphate deaminase